jgi:two-component system, LytTR family, response regulator
MIKAIIVDDEYYCCTVLETLLKKYCPHVNLCATCTSGVEAIEAIRNFRPSLLFLDIEMPGMNGFELLERLDNVDFALVFTTSYDRYALKAFSFSAMDYLLKPIDKDDLIKAVQKAELKPNNNVNRQLEILLERISNPATTNSRIALPTMEGLEFIQTNQVISCTSESNYTNIKLRGNKNFVVSRTLKDIEEMLGTQNFVRVHHSHVINVNEISKYVKGEGGYLVMSDGSTIDVSRSRKEALMQRLIQRKS